MKITNIDYKKLKELQDIKESQVEEERALRHVAKLQVKSARKTFLETKKLYEEKQAESYRPAHKKTEEIKQTQNAIALLLSPIQPGDIVAIKKYRNITAWDFTSLHQKIEYFQHYKVQHVSVHIFEKVAEGVDPFLFRFNTTLIRKKDGTFGKNHSFSLDEIDHIVSKALDKKGNRNA